MANSKVPSSGPGFILGPGSGMIHTSGSTKMYGHGLGRIHGPISGLIHGPFMDSGPHSILYTTQGNRVLSCPFETVYHTF